MARPMSEYERASSSKASEAIAIAERLAASFAASAAERDRVGGCARTERRRLRDSGLLSVFIPEEFGGWGLPVAEVLKLVRIISRADSSLGHVFGFQHLMLATVQLFGTAEQYQRLASTTAKQRWFWGNALNPLDRRTRIQPQGTQFLIEGTKSFCSGSVDADALIVSALDPDDKLMVLALPASRAGILVREDWDGIGQRQTDSGTVELHGVTAEPSELLRSPGPLGSTYASIRPLFAQLILANVYLGIAEGAFGEARKYTRTQARAWHSSGVSSANKDPYVLARYGELLLAIEQARLLTDQAGEQLSRAFARGDELTAEERAHTGVAIALAKVATSRTSLEVSSRVFEVMGARAARASEALDRFWRNARTHTLHDPADYKVRELGEWALNEEPPTPSFYS